MTSQLCQLLNKAISLIVTPELITVKRTTNSVDPFKPKGLYVRNAQIFSRYRSDYHLPNICLFSSRTFKFKF